ncbi:Poly(U)-binding-splicing factor puf60 [Rhizoclosmatium sp. JEL0117]|nr:Poly(U)-binding-splicing factor puf60 [Rhizoclosmatium sp. JEL0117]
MTEPDAKALLAAAKAYARAQTVKMLLSAPKTGAPAVTTLSVASYAAALQFPASFSQQIINAVYASSKLYIGSLHPDIQEPHLRQIFSAYGSIRSLSMSHDPVAGLGEGKHKGFAFIEYDFPEAALLAAEALNGIEFGGRPIKVTKPKDFNPINLDIIPKAPMERIFVANVNEVVDEDMIKGIFEAFGEVEKVSLLSPVSSVTAVTSIRTKGLELAGVKLHVGPAIVGGDLMPGMEALGGIPEVPDTVKVAVRQASVGKTFALPAKPGSLPNVAPLPALPAESAAAQALKAAVAAAKAKIAEENSGIDDEANLSINSSKRYDLMQKMMRPDKPIESEQLPKRRKFSDTPGTENTPSCVLVLKNMVSSEELGDPDLEGEIRDECSKYGQVERVDIVTQGGDGLAEVVVRFSTMQDAEKARVALDGRFFAGRRVFAEFSQ